MRHKLIYFFPLVTALFGVYSYTQVDPNLVLTSQPIYWQLQQWLWQLGYHQRLWSTIIFAALVLLLFGLYLAVLAEIRSRHLNLKQVLVLFGLTVLPLLPSYPALSHDVFNYLMNAKIIAVYHTSPYQHAAWDFPGDPWLMFMNNIEVTTPYGRAWTGIGYLTYLAAGGDLQIGMLMFRLLALLAVSITGWGIYRLSPNNKLLNLAYFLFSPIVWFEAVNNMHNDITMMAWFIGALGIAHRLPRMKAAVIIGVLWVISVLTKLVTIIAPITYGLSLLARRWHWPIDWMGITTLSFIAGLFYDQSHRFFPWYFLWFVPTAALTQSATIKSVVQAFMLSGSLSYVFYLATGSYNISMQWMRILTIFAVPAGTGIYALGKRCLHAK